MAIIYVHEKFSVPTLHIGNKDSWFQREEGSITYIFAQPSNTSKAGCNVSLANPGFSLL